MNSIKTSLLYLLLVCSLTAILIIFVTLPTVTSIRENKKTLSAKQTEFVSNEEKVSILRGLQKNQDSLTARIDKINSLWPDQSEVSNFIVNLENISAFENINLKNIAMSEPKTAASNSTASKAKKKKSVQFSFDTQASFAQNLAIIKNMERLSRFNSIKQLNLTRGEDDVVFMKITGNIYYGQ